MEQEDDEFEKLLWEIQTPPPGEELHPGDGPFSDEADPPAATTMAVQAVHSATSLAFYVPCSGFRQLSLELQEKQPQSFLESKQQLRHALHDGQFLPSAFANLKVDGVPNPEADSCGYPENGSNSSHLDNNIVADPPNGGSQTVSSSEYPHTDSMEAFSEFTSTPSAAQEPFVLTPVPLMNGFSQSLSFASDALHTESSKGLNGFAPVLWREVPPVLSNYDSLARNFQPYAKCTAVPHPAEHEQGTDLDSLGAAIETTLPVQSWHQYHHEDISATSMVNSPLHLKLPSIMEPEMTYVHTQQLGSFQHTQMLVKEGRVQNRQLMQQQFFIRQQRLQEQHTRFYESLQAHSGSMASLHSKVPCLNRTDRQTSWNFPLAINFQQQHLHTHRLIDAGWKRYDSLTAGSFDAPSASGAFDLSEANVLSQHADTCHYYVQGLCGRDANCPFLHPQRQNETIPLPAGVVMNGGLSSELIHSENALPCKLPRSSCVAASAIEKVKDVLANGQPHINHLSFQIKPYTFHSVATKSNTHEPKEVSRYANLEHHALQQQHLKYSSLEDVEGRIFNVAKDQHGCRFLQRKFEEGSTENVQKIFSEIIDHIIELMIDPFGNYLVQKLLDVCNESQLMEILKRVSGKGQLVTVSLNMHGTRAVQKLIESLKSPEQVAVVISSLKKGTVALIKDLNGNHVIQRCLQCLCNDDNQFIFDAATSHCVEIATHRHGCCVLQRCVDFASGSQSHHLVAEIASNALVLSQDPFGNYIVQYILDLAIPWAIMDVITCLEGNFACLSMQKFSSNVVEKCLKLAGEENKAGIIKELMSSSQLDQLLQDPYANYVVQCALTVSKGSLHTSLIDVIKHHIPVLRSSPYGKRILSRTGIKSKQVL